MVKRHSQLFIIPLLMFSCNPDRQDSLRRIEELVETTRLEFAPDKRVALFDISVEKVDQALVLKGESNLPEALASLRESISQVGMEVMDSIDLLVSSKAIVKISVANLRSNPRHSAELSTQALLGMILNVYKKESNWYLVQTPDQYLAWTDSGALELIDDNRLAEYESASKIIVTEPYGFVREAADERSPTLSDITIGNVLELISEKKDFFEVKFPDDRTGFVLKSLAMVYTDWLDILDPNTERLVSRAHEFMGVPYLWGGTSFKGVDCSGFTKMVYLMNGRIIPRDASQQVHTGLKVDDTRKFESLIAGDLLFFGRPATDSTRERVVHVAMWIGDGRYIHSSGRVQINSMDPDDPLFSQSRYNSYLRSKRILNHETDGVTILK